MTPDPSEDRMRLIHAALDGELDAAGMLRAEEMMAEDPYLADEYRRLQAFQQALRRNPPRDGAPEALRARIAAMAAAPAAPAAPRRAAPPRRGPRQAFALAASLVIGVFIGASALRQPAPSSSDAEDAALAGYIRGRLSGQPVDVVSSDRHTVKPWLAGKVAGATTVVDLKSEGFPLTGGRIDVIGIEPVPTLIYQRREHQIALTEIPDEGPASGLRLASRDGYTLAQWREAGRRYLAVSDLPAAEMTLFGEAFRRAAAAEREVPPKP